MKHQTQPYLSSKRIPKTNIHYVHVRVLLQSARELHFVLGKITGL